MPIYAYKCASCGFAKDVLQKYSDAPLSQCPSCGEASFQKQLTAAGFQLKGSGWYATDFKGGNKGVPAGGDNAPASGDAKSDGKSDGKSDAGGDGKSEVKKSDAAAVKKADSAPAAGSGT